MASPTYFPDLIWLSKEVTLSNPPFSSSVWKLTRKLREESFPDTEEDARDYGAVPSAYAVFEAHSLQSTSETGIIEVGMQIPYLGTEYFPSSERQKQASDQASIGMRLETKAYTLLFNAASKSTPTFIGTFKDTQASDSPFVPGGWIQYLAYTPVTGIRLGTGLGHYFGDGRYRDEGPFWDYSPEERQEIRTAFQRAYKYESGRNIPLHCANLPITLSFLNQNSEMLNAGVHVSLPGLKNLYWDQDRKTLTVYGSFEPEVSGLPYWGDMTPIPFGPLILHVWGLAIPPEDTKDFDVPLTDLAELDWML